MFYFKLVSQQNSVIPGHFPVVHCKLRRENWFGFALFNFIARWFILHTSRCFHDIFMKRVTKQS